MPPLRLRLPPGTDAALGARTRRRSRGRRDVGLIRIDIEHLRGGAVRVARPSAPATYVFAFAVFAAIALALSAPSRPAQARTLARVTLPDSLAVDGASLRLNGMALYEKFTFDVLVAGLYLERPERSAERVLAADAPRRYVARFLRDVGARRIRDAWRKGFARNSPDASAEVRAQFEQLCGWVRDFHRGDEIVVTYVPGRGSEVVISGARVGVILGKGFADAYFALALGPKPVPGEKFKRRLLGG